VLTNQEQPLQRREYGPIEVPKNSPSGFVTAFFAVIMGFALIWHIWWMAGVGLLGAAATLLVFMFRAEDEVEISAEQVALFDRTHPVKVSL
jgi:cytochrome o ubiquinol oxidase subunit 1